MKKWIILIVCSLCLSACSWQGVKDYFIGKKKDVVTIDPITKEKTVVTTYEPAPIDAWMPLLSVFVPGLGVAAAAAMRMARKATKTKDALMDANKLAIEGADWKKINSAESFKILLKDSQGIHSDAKLLRKEYVKWRDKRATKEANAKIRKLVKK